MISKDLMPETTVLYVPNKRRIIDPLIPGIIIAADAITDEKNTIVRDIKQ